MAYTSLVFPVPDSVVNFLLYEDEISTAFMCFERICAMFIVPHQAVVQRIRNQCKMKGNKDPTYDPQSKGICTYIFKPGRT